MHSGESTSQQDELQPIGNQDAERLWHRWVASALLPPSPFSRRGQSYADLLTARPRGAWHGNGFTILKPACPDRRGGRPFGRALEHAARQEPQPQPNPDALARRLAISGDCGRHVAGLFAALGLDG